jgi:putative ABC transport system ATP-binding protein
MSRPTPPGDSADEPEVIDLGLSYEPPPVAPSAETGPPVGVLPVGAPPVGPRHASAPAAPDRGVEGGSDVSALPVAGPEVVAASVRYVRAGRVILDDLDIAAHPGQILAVTGPSGSGKSSLLALLAGLERPDGGRVLVDGAPVDGVPAGVGLVLQSYGLVGVLTAAENVEVALQALRPKIDRAQIRARARAVLASLEVADASDQLVDQLSGGQQQRVAIARALVVAPRLLLADELTAELNHETKQLVLGRVREMADRGATVVIATHDDEVASICDRSVHLVDGRIQG